MWSYSKRLAYMMANLFAKESEKRRQGANEKLEGNPVASITPTPCPLPGLRREEAITVTHTVDSF